MNRKGSNRQSNALLQYFFSNCESFPSYYELPIYNPSVNCVVSVRKRIPYCADARKDVTHTFSVPLIHTKP